MITATRNALCFYCDGIRPVSQSGICHGCSSNVPANAPQQVRRKQPCPKCTDGVLRRVSEGMFLTCVGCGYTSGTAMDRTLQRRA